MNCLFSKLPLQLVLLMLLAFNTHQAFSTTLYLNKDCAAAGLTQNCYQTIDEVQVKLWGKVTDFGLPFGDKLVIQPETINPNANNPVTVLIGEGTFSGQFSCSVMLGDENLGYVSFIGQGRDNTVLTHPYMVFHSAGCGNLMFQDLTMLNVGAAGTLAATTYFWGWGIGDTTWNNVKLESINGIPWYEVSNFVSSGTNCKTAPLPAYVLNAPRQNHYFFNSTIIGAKTPYIGACGQTWMYSSEIIMKTNPATGLVSGFDDILPIVLVYREGDVRLFGTSVRVDVSAGVPPELRSVVGVHVGGAEFDGVFHMHGGDIDIDTSSIAGLNAVGIENITTDAGSIAHTLNTPIFVKSAAGANSTRLKGVGKIFSPQLWSPDVEPPEHNVNTGNFASLNGQDMFVETDCGNSSCSNGGNKPHLMVYSDACNAETGQPWFNNVTGECRQ